MNPSGAGDIPKSNRPEESAAVRRSDSLPQAAGKKLRATVHPGIFVPKQSWIGPLMVAITVALGIVAVKTGTGPDGKATTKNIIWGMTALVLMSWSFVLSTRLTVVERLFGGLDGIYRVHRVTGIVAVIAAFVHKRDPSVAWGYMPFDYEVSNLAVKAVEKAFIGALILVAISLVRLIPYNWWRWSHKLFAVVYGISVWHVVTTARPFGPSSWAQWFTYVIIAAGVLAMLYRLVWVDMLKPGTAYTITSATSNARSVDLTLSPTGRPVVHAPGQNVVVRIQHPGLREPHFFSIASGPREDKSLRLVIRSLGDWTTKLATQAPTLVGAKVSVEGPYGDFAMINGQGRQFWVAGGVGITPFLSQMESLQSSSRHAQATPGEAGSDSVPVLLWAVRSAADAPAIETVRAAAAAGVVDVRFFESRSGSPLTPESLTETLRTVCGAEQLTGAHVAVCGPDALVNDVVLTARGARVKSIAAESFDLRAGVGPSKLKQVSR